MAFLPVERVWSMKKCFFRAHYLCASITALALFLLPSLLLAEPSFQPVFKPTLHISPATAPVQIDGNIAEPAWRTAARSANFVERYPGDMTKPDVLTEVYVTYDSANLYVAFVCHDDPGQIRATMCQRDQFPSDDAVGLMLDTYSSASWAYEFFVNAHGIQRDNLWSSISGDDPGFDLNWVSAAQITDSGYQVEMAIPLANLRLPSKDIQSWKADFRRSRPRESNTEYSWAAYDRNERCGPCQWGTVEGVTMPRQEQSLEILPTFVASEAGNLPDRRDPGSKFDDGEIMGSPSVGIKYSVTSNIIIDGAVNPDFSQIESDAAQIDVNSPIALYYPERRPFFQEGSDIFRTLFNSFYSRSINDPEYAAKLTARSDRTTIGFLSALDDVSPYVIPLDEGDITIDGGKSTVNVVRGLHTIGNGNQVGFIVGDRRFSAGGSGTIVALDGDIRLSKNYGIDGQYVLSHTREPNDHSHSAFFEGDVPLGWEDSLDYFLGDMTFDGGKHTVAFDGESFYGTGLITRLKRNSRSWNFLIDYNQVTPSYRTEIGFDPYMNYRNFSISTWYTFYPESTFVERITPQLFSLQRWDFDGIRKLQFINASLGTQFKFAQTYLGVSFQQREEMYAGTLFKDLWTAGFNTSSQISNTVGYELGMHYGPDIAYFQNTKGNQTAFYAGVDLKPIDRLSIEPTCSFVQSVHIDNKDVLFKQLIMRTRFRLQVSRQMSLRLVAQYNSFDLLVYDGSEGTTSRSRKWEFDPLLTYRLGSFSVFYLGSTSDYRHVDNMLDGVERWRLTERQYFMKIQYQFQT